MKDLVINMSPCKYIITVEGLESYIIEYKSIFNWIITKENNTNSILGKDLSWANYWLFNNKDFDRDNYLFNSFEDAYAFLKLYVKHQEILDTYVESLDLLYNPKEAQKMFSRDQFILPADIEFLLLNKSLITSKEVKDIHRSNNYYSGVQFSTALIENLINFEDILNSVIKEYDLTLINYFNFNCSHVSDSAPLYYYIQVDNHFTRWFTLINKGVPLSLYN